MNRKIVNELERLRQQYDEQGDTGRERAYQKAIESVQAHDQRIESGQDAMHLPGIAKGIGWRIDQVLGTRTVDNDSKDAQSACKSDSSKKPARKKQVRPTQSLRPMSEVCNDKPPVRPVRVTFCNDGVSASVSGVAFKRPLTPGVDQSPGCVSRESARKLLQAVQNLVGDTHVVLADQYRRGYREMSRLVFLFTEKTLPKSVRRSERDMKSAISALQEANVLTDVRSIPSDHGGQRYEATANFRSPVPVKIGCALIAVPAAEWPFALARYTGPADTWKRLQSIAESTGRRLTERALISGSVSEICRTEKEIFQRLRLVFIPPEER